MTRSIPEVNCGLICGCIPILPALFQHLRDKQLSTGQDTARKGRFHTLTNYTGRRPPGTERLNTSDIELDEAGLLGHAALNSTKTSVTKGSSEGLKTGSTLHHDQILKKSISSRLLWRWPGRIMVRAGRIVVLRWNSVVDLEQANIIRDFGNDVE